MDTKVYHGKVKASTLAQALAARFNRGNLIARATRSDEQYIVQIASRKDARSGGSTALGITIQEHEDGLTIKLGKQEWLGIAASLGKTLLAVRMNPFNLLSRLDDIAQDIENLNLDDKVWDVIDEVAVTMGMTHELSERLRRTSCPYCNTANPVGQADCIACGAPLGDLQPDPCKHCGYIPSPKEIKCSNCGKTL